MKVCTVAVFAVATLTELRAEAAPPHPIKAEFLCGTYVDGKIKDVVTSGKRPKLSDPIACAIHVPDTNEPSHMGNIHTVRHQSGGKASPPAARPAISAASPMMTRRTSRS